MQHIAAPARIAWGLIWRSTLFFPVSVVFIAFAISTWVARFALPFLIFVLAYLDDWMIVGVSVPVWIASVLLWRWRRFRGLFEVPPSYM